MIGVGTMEMPGEVPFFAEIDDHGLCVVTAMKKEMDVFEHKSRGMKIPFPGQVEVHMDFEILSSGIKYVESFIAFYKYLENQDELKIKYAEYLI